MTKVHSFDSPKTFSKRDGQYGSYGLHGRNWPHHPDSVRFPELALRKVEADTVPYGPSIFKNGRTVWAAYHDGEYVCCGATREECRSK